jgi:hypothetical protein
LRPPLIVVVVFAWLAARGARGRHPRWLRRANSLEIRPAMRLSASRWDRCR